MALTIIRDFNGGDPPLNSVGTGDLVHIFNEAADQWEEAIQDSHILSVHYGWGTGTYHSLMNQGGSPNRETEAFISFNNDNVEEHHKYYLDPIPYLNEEYLAYSEASIDLGSGNINVGRVFYNATGDAAAGPNHLDLLTVALHEIGHALGLSTSNWSWQAESQDGDIDVTAPRPFPGAVVPLDTNIYGQVTSHLARNLVPGIPGPVMSGHSPHQRYLLSEIDILAMAQLSEFKNVDLNPYDDQSKAWYSTPSGDQRYPWVDFNETTGEYLAVWQDKRNGTFDDIYGVRLDQNGNRIGSDIAISLNSGHQQRTLVMSGGGGYLVVWQELKDYAANGVDIYGAWVDGSGSGNVGPQMAICACPGDQWLPRVGYDPVSNTFLVVYLYWNVSHFDLWGSVVPAGGGGSGSPFAMVSVSGDQRMPQLGYDWENGWYYMAWNDRRGGQYDIYGSRVSSTGTLMDGTGVLLGGAPGNQFRPTIVDRRPSAGINNHLVAWNDYRSGSEADVYGVYVDGSGAVVGSEIPISLSSGDAVHVIADVDWIRTKQSVVGWVDNRNGTDYDVYRSAVDQAGVVHGDYPVEGVDTGASDQQQAQVVSYATDGVYDYGFLVIWMDKRNGTDYDIWGIKIWP